MKIAIAQINPRVGDLENNYLAAKEAMGQARKVEAALVVFSELAVMGYPPKDLLEKPDFLEAVSEYNRKWEKLADEKTGILFGSVISSVGPGKPLANAAILSNGGGMSLRTTKCLLPTYDVFDEQRYFKPNTQPRMMIYKGMKIATVLCEDSWISYSNHLYDINPMEKMIGSDVIINLSASPYCIGKHQVRVDLLSGIAKAHKTPLIYCNQVGANDDVIYDGHSLAFDAKGQCCVGMASCGIDFMIVDTENMILGDLDHSPESFLSETAEIHKALVMGVRDYVQKTSFSKVVIGLSGGIDSAVTACIAVEALGAENVVGIGMPSKFSSAGSRNDAKALAERLGVEFHLVPILGVYDAYGEALEPLFKKSSKTELWQENIQARIRGAMLMAFSNKHGHLLLTTGNKSEIAMGYATLYGDMAGGLAVISDLLKGRVYDQAKYINETNPRKPIPRDTIEKAPSAELRPNQVDQDSLPPYPVLDFVLQMYVEEGAEPHHIATELARKKIKDLSMFAASKLVNDIIRRVDAAEFKRKQLPPGLRITKKAFGTGRQMPIAQGWKGMP